jgi:transposase
MSDAVGYLRRGRCCSTRPRRRRNGQSGAVTGRRRRLLATPDYLRLLADLVLPGAEAAGLQVWLAGARDVKHLPGRGKSDREDCVWLCKLNERGMLRRSFVPPEQIRDLRSLTRTRSRLAQDQVRHQNRVEKILEDALLTELPDVAAAQETQPSPRLIVGRPKGPDHRAVAAMSAA